MDMHYISVANKLSTIYVPIKLYIKLFATYTLKNNTIQLHLGYCKPQDRYVSLNYKNISNGYKTVHPAYEYTFQTTKLVKLNIK